MLKPLSRLNDWRMLSRLGYALAASSHFFGVISEGWASHLLSDSQARSGRSLTCCNDQGSSTAWQSWTHRAAQKASSAEDRSSQTADSGRVPQYSTRSSTMPRSLAYNRSPPWTKRSRSTCFCLSRRRRPPWPTWLDQNADTLGASPPQ